MATGAASKVGLGPEAVFGTAVVPTFGVAAKTSIKPTRDTIRYDGAGTGNATQVGDPGRTRQQGGMTDTPVSPAMIGNLLRAACGTRSTFVAAVPAVSPAVHTFRPALQPLTPSQARPSYTAHIERNAAKIDRFSGGQCDKITFECSSDGRLIVSTDWFFKNYLSSVTATPALDNSAPFRYKNAVHAIAAAPAAPASFAFFKNIKIELMNNIIVNECQDGTDDANSFFLGQVLVKVSGTICYNDSILANAWESNTVQNVKLSYVQSAFLGLDFNIPQLRLDDVDDFSIGNAGLLEQPFSGTAEYDNGIANMISIVLRNNNADYA